MVAITSSQMQHTEGLHINNTAPSQSFTKASAPKHQRMIPVFC